MFAIQVWRDNNDNDNNDRGYIIVFIISLIFIIFPILYNIFQLHKEISIWINDVDINSVIILWIEQNIKYLYFVSIIFGSSFTAIELSNCGLFCLNKCNMGLNKHQLAIFANKRLFSVILFENIPQIILQFIYIFIISKHVTFIIILSIIFSLISIIICIFEYLSQNVLLNVNEMCIVKFEIISKKISMVNKKLFNKHIVYKRRKLSNELSKLLNIDTYFIELLKPIQTDYGLDLIFNIRYETIGNKRIGNILNKINDNTNKRGLRQVKLIFV